jgi:hypothetical protein
MLDWPRVYTVYRTSLRGGNVTVAAGQGARSSATSGALKQEILRLYNAVNQEMWRVGVRRQRVDLLGDRIVIVAEHERVPALAVLDADHRPLTRMVDGALLDENKRRLADVLGEALGVGIRVVLKDYDPTTQLAATVVLLDRPLLTEGA